MIVSFSKAKKQYLLTCKVSRYCFLAWHGIVAWTCLWRVKLFTTKCFPYVVGCYINRIAAGLRGKLHWCRGEKEKWFTIFLVNCEWVNESDHKSFSAYFRQRRMRSRNYVLAVYCTIAGTAHHIPLHKLERKVYAQPRSHCRLRVHRPNWATWTDWSASETLRSTD